MLLLSLFLCLNKSATFRAAAAAVLLKSCSSFLLKLCESGLGGGNPGPTRPSAVCPSLSSLCARQVTGCVKGHGKKKRMFLNVYKNHPPLCQSASLMCGKQRREVTKYNCKLHESRIFTGIDTVLEQFVFWLWLPTFGKKYLYLILLLLEKKMLLTF